MLHRLHNPMVSPDLTTQALSFRVPAGGVLRASVMEAARLHADRMRAHFDKQGIKLGPQNVHLDEYLSGRRRPLAYARALSTEASHDAPVLASLRLSQDGERLEFGPHLLAEQFRLNQIDAALPDGAFWLGPDSALWVETARPAPEGADLSISIFFAWRKEPGDLWLA